MYCLKEGPWQYFGLYAYVVQGKVLLDPKQIDFSGLPPPPNPKGFEEWEVEA